MPLQCFCCNFHDNFQNYRVFKMEIYEEFYKSICRVCLSHGNSEAMVSLVDISSEDGLSCYGKSVISFANVNIKDDCLPNKMCTKCLYRLKQAILFKKICEESHQKLTKLVRKFKCSDLELKEKVSQYVMFSNYFPQDWNEKSSKKCKIKNRPNKTCQKPIDLVKNESENESNFDDISSTSFQEENLNSDRNTDNESSNNEEIFDRIEKLIKIEPEKLNNKKIKSPRVTIKQKKQRTVKPKLQKTGIQCKVCNKTLANLSTYNSHMHRHTGGRFVCEHCANKYATYAELQYHLASTHDIGPHFICKECGYKAPRKFDLMEHKRLHTGERPYTCDKCGLTFRRRFVWRKHALYHTEKTVQCPRCPRKFHQRSEMLAHANNVHERVYVYACNICDVTYARTATVRRHLIEKHGIAREVQGRITRINLGKPSIK